MSKRGGWMMVALLLIACTLAPGMAAAASGEVELTPAAFNKCTGVYKTNSSGSCVSLIQTALKKAGHDPGPIDGIFGSRTTTATRAFQKKHGLEVDGKVGKLTMAKLKEVTTTSTDTGPGSGTTTPPPAPAPTFRDPMTVPYRIGDRFGTIDRKSGHGGIDLAPNDISKDAPVVAAADGKVLRVGWENPKNQKQGWGLYVEISHPGGPNTVYAHLKVGSPTVKPGDQVKAGQTIAIVGSTGASTGPHLHFETWLNGKKVDPQNYVTFTGKP